MICTVRIFISLFILLLLSCKESQTSDLEQTNSLDVDAEMQVLRYLKEVEWPQAYREQDTVLLDRILGHDFQMVAANGEWSDKEEQMARIKAASMDHDFFEYEIKRLEVHENGTAIVAGTGHIINDGKEMIYQSSNVLIKRGALWKAVLSHVSGITELKEAHHHTETKLPKEGDFSYLLGDWRRTNEVAGKETYEHWKKISDTEYAGLGYTLVEGDTVWMETIQLVREEDHWHYEVLGKGDSIVTPFKVTKTGENSFECFNPLNEFPKTILYKKEVDTLFASISDGEREIDFKFVKVIQ